MDRKTKKERPKSRFIQELESQPEIDVEEKYLLLAAQYEKERKRSGFFYKQIGGLETKIEKMNKMYNNLNDALQAQESINLKLRNSIEEQELTINGLRNQLELATNESYELKKTIDFHKDKVDASIQEVKHHSHRCVVLELRESQHLDDIEALNSKITLQTSTHKEQLDSLKSSHSNQMQSQLAFVDELNKKIELLKSENAELVSKHTQLDNEKIQRLSIQFNDSSNQTEHVRILVEPSADQMIQATPDTVDYSTVTDLEYVKQPQNELINLSLLDNFIYSSDSKNGRENTQAIKSQSTLIQTDQIEETIIKSPMDFVFQQEMDILQNENTRLSMQLQQLKLDSNRLFFEFDKANPHHKELSPMNKMKVLLSSSRYSTINSQMGQTLSQKSPGDRSDGSTNADVEFNDTCTDVELDVASIRNQYIEMVGNKDKKANDHMSPIEYALDDLASCLSQLMFSCKFKQSPSTTMVQLNRLSIQMQEMRDDVLLKDVEIRSLRDKNELLRDSIRAQLHSKHKQQEAELDLD
eukprot:NODE_79_length_22985_cov_0.358401.p3 type:complete len:526 gc:universal NODE_79_length_22985_cov_0.358401:6869-8446(+)